MIKQSKVVDFYNKYISNARAQNVCKEFQPITDDMFRRWIQSGRVLGREEYSPSDIVEWVSRAQINDSMAMSAGHKWSARIARDFNRIRALRRLGKTIKETATIQGCSESTVKRATSERGNLLGLIGKKNHRYAIIQTLYEDGWTKQAIMEEVVVSDRTIRRALNEAKLDKRFKFQ